MSHKYDDLPTWEELCALRDWVLAGCPAAHPEGAQRVATLVKLLKGLPHHFPHLAWGTDEWRAELARLRSTRIVCHADGCDGTVIEDSDYCAEHQG